jgi:hypothetical protein
MVKRKEFREYFEVAQDFVLAQERGEVEWMEECKVWMRGFEERIPLGWPCKVIC